MKLTFALALVLASTFASAADYYVVLPVKGKLAAAPAPEAIISVTLNPAALPPATTWKTYRARLADYLVITGDPELDVSKASWTAVGALPSGLSLLENGELTGTPNAAGAASVQVQVGYKSKTAAQTYALQVNRLDYSIGFNGTWDSADGTGTPSAATLTLSSAVAREGGGSLFSSPAGAADDARVSFPASPAMQVGTGDFTFEAWGYRTATNGANSAGIATLMAPNQVQLLVDDAPVAAGTPAVAYPSFTIAGGTYGSKAFQVPLQQWVKYSLVRRAGVVRFYVNDVQQPISTYQPSAPHEFTDTTVSELRVSEAINPTGVLVANRGTLARQWRGYIDAVRVTRD